MIRRATPSDLTTMTVLVQQTIRQSNAKDYSAGEIERIILVARIDNDMVGTASLGNDGRQVHMVFVDPDRQGEGLGTRLMEEIERLASAAGTTTLNVSASRSAVDFNKARDYVVEGPESAGEISTLPMKKMLAPDEVTPP